MPQYKNNIQATFTPSILVFQNDLNCGLSSWVDCPEKNIGGVSKLFFANFSSVGYAFLNSDGEVTGFENPLVLEWVYLPFNKNQPEVSTTTEIADNGTRWVTNVTAQISKQGSLRRNIFISMVNGRFGCIALDKNGTYWLFGNQYPLRANSNDKASGKSPVDFNGDLVTLTTTADYPPRVLTQECVDGLIFDLSANCAELAGYPEASPLPLAALAGCDVSLYSSMIL